MDARWIDAAGLDGWMDAAFSVRILTVFRHYVRAFLLCSSTQCCTQCTQCCALLGRNACMQCWNAVIFVCMCWGWMDGWVDGWMDEWMLHPLCAFLLYSGTVCVHSYYVQAHSAAHSALSATVFRHCVRAFLLYSSTFLVALTPYCMYITLLLHYYTSESQHFLRVLTLFFASSQPASQSS